MNFLHQDLRKFSSDRQTDRIVRNYKPCRFTGDQKGSAPMAAGPKTDDDDNDGPG